MSSVETRERSMLRRPSIFMAEKNAVSASRVKGHSRHLKVEEIDGLFRGKTIQDFGMGPGVTQCQKYSLRSLQMQASVGIDGLQNATL